MSFIQSLILALIEGLTEFLPVSSTGHLIIATSLMGIEPDSFVKLYLIAVQPGAILAVLFLYQKRFFKSTGFYLKLLAGFIPAAIIGLAFNDTIDLLLESPLTVAVSLFVGGVIFLFLDSWFSQNEKESNQDITYKRAWYVGFFQILAMIPGTSRSGATIAGGLVAGFNKKNAAEFSFFLGVPTLFAATAYKIYKFYGEEGGEVLLSHFGFLFWGNVVAFIVGMLSIKFFIGFLTKHGFKWFGWYRIIVGALIMILILSGVSLELV